MIKTLSHHIIPYVFRCKQFAWMGNVSKTNLNDFKWLKNLSKFDERFIKNYDENSSKGCFLKVDLVYPKNSLSLHMDLPFLSKKIKLKNLISLFVTYMKKNKLCCAYKSFKTNIKSRINTKKNTQNNSI